ncbi:CPBP family intramembrane glutamic endopeptidase [Clostridium intestinale]|uniref:CPBP family intramembrane glutamic endopeptidase n=1 Tax=Clostridium intestinale TaxID=36845 RepID=UPI0028E4B070|nr:CPBP family intramembrane glutamic endopeptidase [Clostridium intestinale]
MITKLKRIFGILGEFEKGRLKVERIGFFKALGVLFIWQLFAMVPELISTGIYAIKKEYYMIPVSFILQFICNLFFVYIIFRIFTLPNTEEVRKKAVKTKKMILFSILILFGYRIFYVGTLEHIMNILPMPQFIEDIFNMLQIDDIQAWGFLLSSIFIAPIVEEVVCRGIIFNGLRKRYSDLWAILISSFLFGFIHLNLQQGINAFIIGVLFSWVYVKTNSLYLCMALHAFNNFIINPMYYVIGEGEKAVIASILFAVFGLLISVIGIRYFIKETDKTKEDNSIEIIEF